MVKIVLRPNYNAGDVVYSQWQTDSTLLMISRNPDTVALIKMSTDL